MREIIRAVIAGTLLPSVHIGSLPFSLKKLAEGLSVVAYAHSISAQL